MIKKIVVILYVAVLIVLGTATFIERSEGRPYALAHIYGSWWFSLLWALLVAFGIAWMVKRRVRRWSVVLLHGSLVLILAGAFITHLFSRQGVVHLREGEITDQYYVQAGESGLKAAAFPFQVRLDKFDIIYHEGTEAAADYVSRLAIIDNGKAVEGVVSMNNIFSYRGYRMYQNDFDEDLHGSVLSINNDPWGIGVTYIGYALLFFSLLWLLVDPKGAFRENVGKLRSYCPKGESAPTRHCLLLFCLFTFMPLHTSAQPTLPSETAKEFGQLHILYNDRICPVQTFAIDFTRKLYGKGHYKEFSAEQVLAGFIFWGDEWANEPIVKVKGEELRQRLGIGKYVSVNTLFQKMEDGRWKMDVSQSSIYHLQSKLMLVMNLRTGTLLRMFPTTHDGKTTWNSPSGKLPATVSTEDAVFISSAFNMLYLDTQAKDFSHFGSDMGEIKLFQKQNSGTSMPSAVRDKAEYIYNKVPFATILSMVNLAMGLLCFFMVQSSKFIVHSLVRLPFTMNCFHASFITLTLCIALRWIIKGTLPMSNGYETMLFIAWFVMLATILVRFFVRDMPGYLSSLIVMMGFLSSGFFLLVSHINQMDPQITHLMPVLNSPLLSLHVSVIMMAYALLSLTFICGIIGLVMKGSAEQLAVLSRLLLYPSITTMGIGIFTGAIWANVSWGQYWSWDPKETWALITFMVYAIAVHQQSLPVFRKPRIYHAFMVFAFLAILMTYFGVNYMLGGMHSYTT